MGEVSSLEGALIELKMAKLLVGTMGEAIEDFKCHKVTVLTLGRQWRELQSSFDVVEGRVEKRVREVEEKERERSGQVKVLEERERRLVYQAEKMEVLEKRVSEERKALEEREARVGVREREVEEGRKRVVGMKKEMEGLCEVMEVKGMELVEGFRKLGEREEEVEGLGRAVEGREREVGERWEGLESKEKDVEERLRELKVREKNVEECGRVVEEKWKELESRKEFEERLREVEIREKKVEEGVRVVEEKWKELESREKEVEERWERLRVRREEVKGCGRQMEERERVVRERWKELENRRHEVEERWRELEVKEEVVKEYGRGVEIGKKKVKEGFRTLELKGKEVDERLRKAMVKEKEIGERCREVELREGKVKEMDEYCKGLEMKVKEFNDGVKILKSKLMEVEERSKELELKEKDIESRWKEVELREREADECGQLVGYADSPEVKKKETDQEHTGEVDAKEKEIDELWQQLEVKEKLMLTRERTLEAREQEIDERWQQLEVKEKLMVTRHRTLEVREQEMGERELAAESKEKQTSELSFVLELKKKQVSVKFDSMKLKETQVRELLESQESEAKKLNDLSRELALKDEQIDRLCEALELREEEIDKRSREIEQRETLLSCADEVDVELCKICLSENGSALITYLNEKVNEHQAIGESVGSALKLLEDPAKLVLPAIDGFFSPLLTKGNVELLNDINVVRRSCVLLLEQLIAAKPVVSEIVRKDALNLARFWRKSMKAEGESDIVVLGFLMLLVAYDLGSDFKKDDLVRLYEMVDQHKLAPHFCRSLGLLKRKKGFTESPALAQARREQPQVQNVLATYSVSPSAGHSCDTSLPCEHMDVNGMRTYLVEHVKEYNTFHETILNSVSSAIDPAEFVLNVTQCLFELDNVPRDVCIACCTCLLAHFMKIQADITPLVKEEASKFAANWRDSLVEQGSKPLEACGFLQFLASYELAGSYPTDKLLFLFGTLFDDDNSEVCQPKQIQYLCNALGLAKEIPGLIGSLILEHKLLQAVRYICALKLKDACPPIPLLEGHMKLIQMRVKKIASGSSESAQDDAAFLELLSLKAVLKCVSIVKLESDFPPAPLQSRIQQLEKEKEETKNQPKLIQQKHLLSAIKQVDSSDSEEKEEVPPVSVVEKKTSEKSSCSGPRLLENSSDSDMEIDMCQSSQMELKASERSGFSGPGQLANTGDSKKEEQVAAISEKSHFSSTRPNLQGKKQSEEHLKVVAPRGSVSHRSHHSSLNYLDHTRYAYPVLLHSRPFAASPGVPTAGCTWSYI